MTMTRLPLSEYTNEEVLARLGEYIAQINDPNSPLWTRWRCCGAEVKTHGLTFADCPCGESPDRT